MPVALVQVLLLEVPGDWLSSYRFLCRMKLETVSVAGCPSELVLHVLIEAFLCLRVGSLC